MSGAVYDERPTVKSKVDRGNMVVTIPLPVPSPDEKMGGRLADFKEKIFKARYISDVDKISY